MKEIIDIMFQLIAFITVITILTTLIVGISYIVSCAINDYMIMPIKNKLSKKSSVAIRLEATEAKLKRLHSYYEILNKDYWQLQSRYYSVCGKLSCAAQSMDDLVSTIDEEY